MKPPFSLSSFGYLNVTQFLGAMIDNIYKLLIIYFLIELKGIENSPTILATTGAVFVLPFLLFSSFSGMLADRFSKSRIIVGTKVFELAIMLVGLLGFSFGSEWGVYSILFLLATHSALFSPSKYGILPDLLPPERISFANGFMTSSTYLAVILGTFLASFILDITGKNFIIAALFCTAMSFIGMLSSLCISYTPPSGSEKRLNAHFLGEIYKTLKMARNEPSLLAALLGSAFFLFLAAYVQLNIIPFGVQSLNLTDVQGGYLFLLTAIGIGTGSILSGKISGKMVELALVPLAGFGITASFYFLDIFSHRLDVCIALVVIIGLFGGIYLVPLDSYVQISAPKQYIGQAIAASTFLSFVGVLCASGLLFLLLHTLGLTAAKGFLVLGTMTLIVSVVYAFLFFDYLTRFIGMILSRIHFKIEFNGQKNIPKAPAIYICTHTAWNDTLLLLGAQRRRMRFFIEKEQAHAKWMRKLYGLLRVVLIPEIKPLEDNPICLQAIKRMLMKGISVCIFVDSEDPEGALQRLKQAPLMQDILQEQKVPVLRVCIDKLQKDRRYPFFRRLLNKFRVPAKVYFEVLAEGTPFVYGDEIGNPENLPLLTWDQHEHLTPLLE
jgi:acyl-[acyl-carrier-protein]-phospholipid O-acyltransferase/long-chain-fatty-acid--[acyl-carrier-protein] ligase